jgi:tRNA threonylcarbamoyl adenosine modification protein YeaZ
VLALVLDTSTPTVTAGLIEDRDEPRLLAERTAVDAFGHAERLMPLVTEALDAAGRRLTDVNHIVVGLGPGPFTGLRVGIATAAALADGLGIPVHGVPSHAGAAGGLDAVLVVTDARRREVYASVYAGGTSVAGPEPVAPAALQDWLSALPAQPSAVTGPASLLVSELGLPIVEAAVPLSLGLFQAADLDAAPGPLTPLYLRRPDATAPTATKSVLT